VKRVCAAVATVAILIGLIPGAVSAGRVEKFSDHFVFASCDLPIDAGLISGFVEVSTDSDFSSVGLDVWLDPDIPFETEPTISGSTDTIDLTDDGTTIQAHGTFQTFDIDGNPEGDAELTIMLARTGEIRPFLPEPGKSNVNEKTSGFEERLEGSATLTWDGAEYALPECQGSVGDIAFMRTSPRAFVSANSGVSIHCLWETDAVVAEFDATEDEHGYFAGAFLETPAGPLFNIDAPPGSVTASGLDATFELDNSVSAVATATFTPTGSPVTSTLYGATFRTKAVEQGLVPVGSIEYSTGDTFVIDDEHCDALTFENHTTRSQPSGPKTGRPPANDGPEGAIALKPGSRFNTTNVGATPEPEFQILTCPQGFADRFGRTLWYTIEGTGGPVTIDTAGSAIDTLIGVFVPTDASFEEIACIDDVEFEPVGATFQAALTIDTEVGVTYYVEVGGFFNFFEEATAAEKGRIRIRVR